MTASGTPRAASPGPRRVPGGRLGPRSLNAIWRRLPGPDQGWSSLVLLLVMLWATGVAVDDGRWAGWTATGDSQTAFVPQLMLASGLLGSLLAMTRLPTGWANLAMATLGAAVVLVVAADAISTAPDLHARLRDLNTSVAEFARVVIVQGERSSETSALLIVLGAVAWTTGQFSGLAVFRRSRALPAVAAVGAVLIMALATMRAPSAALVVVAACSLLLYLRLNLTHQQEAWSRRHIAGGRAVTRLFLGGGLTLVAASLAGAVALAAPLSGAPLAGVWRDLDDSMVDVATALDRLLGGITQEVRRVNGVYPDRQPVGGVWNASHEVVFTAVVSDGRPIWWRGAAYDDFDGRSWERTALRSEGVAAGGDLLAGTDDEPLVTRRSEVTVTVTSLALDGRTMHAPDAPLTTDRDAERWTSHDRGTFASIEFRDPIRPGERYLTTASVLDVGGADGGLTQRLLAAAGTSYPAWAKRFVLVRPDSVGELTRSTADQVFARLDQRDPFHIADAIQAYLHDGDFSYQRDIRGACGPDERVTDCLLRTKAGFCQQFATTMTMMLRLLSVPARYVEGYLPGKQLPDGGWEVDGSAAHAWVEVFFPAIGWVRFDPTPGNFENGQVATELPLGPPVPTPPPGGPDASPDFGPQETLGPGPTPDPNEGGGPGAAGSTGSGEPPMALLAAVGAAIIVVGAVGWWWLRRRGRSLADEVELIWQGIAGLAGRLGHGPRPTQTAYEYTAGLSKVVPSVTHELRVVADARVAARYAGRRPEGDALATLRAAYRLARLKLLRLLFRRRRRT
jgi:transglutaminase-like putative cysteine protease